jgi:hypothetical protein
VQRRGRRSPLAGVGRNEDDYLTLAVREYRNRPEQTITEIKVVRDRVRNFAQHQLESLSDFMVERCRTRLVGLHPGPVEAAFRRALGARSRPPDSASHRAPCR